jgi:molybdenum cofactor synthesis domain-containing protein
VESVPVSNAVGMVLCHDITQIIPGKFKGRAFKKGHIIKEEDISRLLDMGKEHIYVWDLNKGFLHENEAANRIAKAAAGQGIKLSEPKEGKVEFRAAIDGLLKINIDALYEINEIQQIVFSTIHGNKHVSDGKILAGTRIVPLVIQEESIKKVEEICSDKFPLIEVRPFRQFNVGVVTTGSEVYKGRIPDKFGPVIFRKMEQLGSKVIGQIFVPDSVDEISNAIQSLIAKGANMITVTGGMSVDPDDLTPAGIRAAGGNVVTYGSPTLPGAMFMLAYIGKIPVVGLPGCVMYHKISVFDLVVPRILAGEKITRKDIIQLAHGGLCLNCDVCRYPDCGFGQ